MGPGAKVDKLFDSHASIKVVPTFSTQSCTAPHGYPAAKFLIEIKKIQLSTEIGVSC
jgi:hypothetical protein